MKIAALLLFYVHIRTTSSSTTTSSLLPTPSSDYSVSLYCYGYADNAFYCFQRFFCSFVLFYVYVDIFRRLLRRLCPTPKPELAAKKCGGTDFGAFVRQILKPPEESERSNWEGVTLTELLKMCRHPSGKVRTVDECMLLFFWV